MTEDLEEFQKKIIEDESELICCMKARQVGGTTAFMKKSNKRIQETNDMIWVLSPSLSQSNRALRMIGERDEKFHSKAVGWENIEVQGLDGFINTLRKAMTPTEPKRMPDVIYVDEPEGLPDGLFSNILDFQEGSDFELWACGSPMGYYKSSSEMYEFFQKEEVSSYHVKYDDVSHLGDEYIERIKDELSEPEKKSAIEGEHIEKEDDDQ